MREASEALDDVLHNGFKSRLIVDVFYDDEELKRDVPVDPGGYSFRWDLESELKSSGSIQVVQADEFGRSMTPREFTDVFAPFGQQVNVLMEISLGSAFRETLQLGRYRINEVPDSADSYSKFLGRPIVSSTALTVTVDDLLSGVKRHGLHWPAPPTHTSSTWDELQRLTGLPVDPSLDDLPTPAGLIYEPKEGGRLVAVQQLASHLGGTAYTTPFGELSAVPFVAGDVVNTLRMGERGRVIEWPASLSSDGLYNCVVGSYQEEDGTPIYSVARIADGPLSADGPYGEYTFYDSSQLVTSQVAADRRVRQVLTRLLASQSYRITVSCILDPRIEFGDVVELVGPTFTLTGRVIAYSFGGNNLMAVTLDVPRDFVL